MLWISLVLFFAGSALAQVPFFGKCPNVETMKHFHAEKYMGKWFEAEKYFAVFQLGGKCVTANYSLNKNGTVHVLNKQISTITGSESSIEGTAKFDGSPDDPKLTVTFPSLPIQVDGPYWVLDTDYKSYAVVWSCTKIGLFSTRSAWILTREPSPPVAVLEKAYKVIDRNNISRGYFTRTDQTNCPATHHRTDDESA